MSDILPSGASTVDVATAAESVLNAPAPETPAPEAPKPDAAPVEGEAAKETEKAPEAPPEPKPDLDKVQRVIAAQKAKRAQQRALIDARVRAQEALQAREAELARERAEREALAKQVARYREDPLGALEADGVTADRIAKKAIEDSAPEAKLARMEAVLEAKLKAIEAKERESQEREQRRQQEALYEQAKGQLLKLASDAERYPVVAEMAEVDPEWVVSRADRILADAYQRTGIRYTMREALEYIEQSYSKKWPTRKAATAEKSPALSKAPTETKTAPSQQEKPQASAPRTLTNQTATQKATIPPNFDDLSDHEQNRILAELLRNGQI